MTTTAIAIRADQDDWTEAQSRALGFGQNVTRADAAIFLHVCQRTGLDPFARQIYMIERPTKDGPKQVIQTGIDGYRLIARRAAGSEGYGYEATEWCGNDGQWRDVWLSDEPPAAARVTITHRGHRFVGVAPWREYVQTYGRSSDPTPMWRKMPSGQLAKCAEALALRRAFPQDLSGIYTDDEMAHADIVNERPVVAPLRPADIVMEVLADPGDEPAPATPMCETTWLRIRRLMHDAGFDVKTWPDAKPVVEVALGRTVDEPECVLESDADALVEHLGRFIMETSGDES